MTKCPKSTLSARLVARSFFLPFVGWCFSHIYKNTRCCCIVGQCIPCLLPFLIYFRLVQFTGNIFVFRSKLIGWSTNTREFFLCVPKLKIQSTNRNLYAFLGQLSCTVALCLSFLALRIVSAYVLLFECFNTVKLFVQHRYFSGCWSFLHCVVNFQIIFSVLFVRHLFYSFLISFSLLFIMNISSPLYRCLHFTLSSIYIVFSIYFFRFRRKIPK